MFLTPDDLTPFADIDPVKAQAMIDDAVATATRVAPCITAPDFEYPDLVKAILRQAILRRNDAGTGAVVQQGAGPFQQTIDSRQPHRSLLWPSEIADLQKLCRDSESSGAWSVDMAAPRASWHADTCALRFGATYCDCGADIAGTPIYGTGAGT